MIGCYSKEVAGWSIASHMRTELVEDAPRNAGETRMLEPFAVFHSERGSVYTSDAYRRLVTPLGMRS